MKRICALILAVLFIVSLTACGEAETSSSNSASSAKADTNLNTIVVAPDIDASVSVSSEQLNVIKVYLDYLVGDEVSVRVDEENHRVLVESEDEFPDGLEGELTAVPSLTFRNANGEVVMDGGEVLSAEAGVLGTDEYVVTIRFTDEGTADFARITEEYLDQTLGVYLDDMMISNPMIYAPITDGQAQISGNLTAQQAADLAAKINAAVLPFGLKAEK